MRIFIATAAVVSLVAAHEFRAGVSAAASGDDQTRQQMRFAAMDTNGDGIITRQEWRGSQRSFDVHDWNGDGRLSGDEVRLGANWPTRTPPDEFNDWSQDRFKWLDVNGDNRITRSEWRYGFEDFFRIDRNRDNIITLREFLIATDDDDDRGDEFAFLDLNNDNRIQRSEWHGSQTTFTWLDRNRDGVLSRVEVAGSEAEGAPGPGGGAGQLAPRTLMVSARQAWTDTGIDVRRGDLITVNPSGMIIYTGNRNDRVPPAGGGANATAAAPRPDLPIGALLGRIGDTQAFLIGAGLDSMRATTAGRLYLGTNDDVLTDNSGEFRAVVTVIRR